MIRVRKPRLYEAGTLEFHNNGIGILVDALQCLVKQAFGSMVLEMEYPVAGRFFKELTYRRIILAESEPLKDMQPFSIYRIIPSSSGSVKIYANHVCYDLQGKPVRPFTADTAPEAMAKLKENAMEEHPFTFETDVGRNGKFVLKQPAATWSILGGVEGSILDVYHGEYEFDNYTVRLLTRRGADRGVSLRYGKNLQSLEQDANCAGCYTGIVPYWVDASTGDAIYAESVKAEGNFGYSRINPVDFTSKFESKPTKAQLAEIGAQYIKDNDIGKPNVSIKVEFVPLDQTEELQHLALLERVQFGDTVHVFFPKLTVDVAARVVETTFDALRGRYKEVTIGKAKHSLSDLMVSQAQQIEKIPQGTALQIAMAQATAAILGAKGGAVRHLDTDGDGMPDTIYVADNADPAKAKNVWRWNYMGWGRSTNGVNGPFTMAATLEGGFVADFITSGTLKADLIKAGTLDAAMIKVINLSAESITTGKLSVDRLDVDKLVVKWLEAIEEREDGFKGIVKTDTGRVKMYSDDGSVVREVINIGVENNDTDNFASNYGRIIVRSYREGVEDYRISIEGNAINTYKDGEQIAAYIQGMLQYYGDAETEPLMALSQYKLEYRLGDHAAEFGMGDNGGYAQIASLYPSGTGNMQWEYIEAIGKTVLVKTS